jgi:lipoprotein-anchoring transpeptidase ErfK/SrfK
LALAGAVAYGVTYYSHRAKPGVTVFGEAVGGQTEAQLTATVTRLAANLVMPLHGAATSTSPKAADIGVTVDVAQTVQAILTATAGEYPWTAYSPWAAKPAAAVVTVDRAELLDYLDDTFVAPSDVTVEADVAYDQTAAQFVVAKSRTGLRVDPQPVIDAVQAFAAGQAPLGPVDVTTQTDPPKLTDAAAQAAVAQANTFLSARVTVTDNYDQTWYERTYEVTAADIAGWTVVTPDPATGRFDVTLDRAKLAADLVPAVNYSVAIPMQPTMTVMDPDAPDQVLGYQWGAPGTAVADEALLVATVADAIEAGATLTYAPPLKEVAVTEYEGLPPTNFDEPGGAKWIDVNKTTYLATAYEGTTQVNQFVISVGRGGEYETADGTFYIYLKYDHQEMCGGTGTVKASDGRPGTWEYCTEVTWVSYFHDDQAFHEADWNTYQSTWQERVSHGCVNVPGEAAEWIYTWAPIGTKVVVHY